MASINQLVSEIAHSLQQADSVPVRRAIKQAIYYARNEVIRRSFENHKYTDKVLQQRIKLSLKSVPDGDINLEDLDLDINIAKIKRTTNKVPRPTRLNNNLPFHSVRTIGVTFPIEIPFIKETSMKFYQHLPGFCPKIGYDYINGYIYIFPFDINFNNISSIIVESVFERPDIIDIDENYKKSIEDKILLDNDEFLLPEDMISDIKRIVLSTINNNIVRETNEVSPISKGK